MSTHILTQLEGICKKYIFFVFEFFAVVAAWTNPSSWSILTPHSHKMQVFLELENAFLPPSTRECCGCVCIIRLHSKTM